MTKNKKPIHDALFKEVYSRHEYSLDIFKLVLSKAEFELFSWKTLKAEISTFVDKDFREKRSDLIFSVKRKFSKKEVKIIFLVEHKSYQDLNLLKQLLEYQTRIYEKKNYPIIPILIYHGDKKDWEGDLDFQQSLEGMDSEIVKKFGRNILQFRPKLLNLRKVNLGRHKNLVSWPVLFILQNIFSLSDEVIETICMVGANMNKKHREDLLTRVVDYVRQYDKQFTWRLFEDIEEKILPEDKRIMGLLKQTEERIKARGIKKGIKEGIEKVALKMLKKGADIRMICEYTELTAEQIEVLKKNGLSKK